MNLKRALYYMILGVVPLMAASCTDYDTNPPVITAENPVLMDAGTVEVNAKPDYNQPSLLRVAPEYLAQEWFDKKVQAALRSM